jgi:hypothetical protein
MRRKEVTWPLQVSREWEMVMSFMPIGPNYIGDLRFRSSEDECSKTYRTMHL